MGQRPQETTIEARPLEEGAHGNGQKRADTVRLVPSERGGDPGNACAGGAVLESTHKVKRDRYDRHGQWCKRKKKDRISEMEDVFMKVSF